jgi:hypothetical protein
MTTYPRRDRKVRSRASVRRRDRGLCRVFGHAYAEYGEFLLEGHYIPVLRCSRCGAES